MDLGFVQHKRYRMKKWTYFDYDVGMWPASFLELDYLNDVYETSKLFMEEKHEPLKLNFECAHYNYGQVICSLPWRQLAHNLGPLAVTGHGYEKRGRTK
jgi:hypothetical protein